MRKSLLALPAVAALGMALSLPPANAACCYFAAKDKDINQPGQKAFITWHPEESIESFTVQPKFEGNAVDFGMVIPTPAQPKLDEMPRDFFKDLAIYTILMPLPQPIWPRLRRIVYRERGGGGRQEGAIPQPSGRVEKPTVRVLESGVVGSLDYKIIVASDASGLYQWLKDNAYSYGGDEDTLKYYIDKSWFFTVMKIDPKAMKKADDGSYVGEVTPTRFTFETQQCVYPLKITQLSVKDKTDALFYVQAPKQMDLTGDLSWMHSYRVMFLTYMLGCGANPEQQRELEERNSWIEAKKAADPRFETTKLEWARKLGDAEVGVLEDPLARYAQMGVENLPPGSAVIEPKDFLDEVWKNYVKDRGDSTSEDEYAKARLKELETQYPKDKGLIVKNASGGNYGLYTFYPNREAPAEDVKGLSRLKGHLQKDHWLTKFRKVIRKDEMADDLVLVPVGDDQVQDYVRIMPTSPP